MVGTVVSNTGFDMHWRSTFVKEAEARNFAAVDDILHSFSTDLQTLQTYIRVSVTNEKGYVTHARPTLRTKRRAHLVTYSFHHIISSTPLCAMQA